MTIADAIYLWCAAASLLAAWLLLRQFRASRTRLRLWSSAAFVGVISMLTLVYGLVWEGGS
jgi:hypothetical protein